MKRKEEVSNYVIYPFLPKQKKGSPRSSSEANNCIFNFRKAFPADQSVFSLRALILATAEASANRNSTQNFLIAVESWVTTANLDSLVKNNSASTIYMTPVRSINSNSWRGSPVSITKVRKSESSNGTPIQKSACRL